jgi:hypothetical protein
LDSKPMRWSRLNSFVLITPLKRSSSSLVENSLLSRIIMMFWISLTKSKGESWLFWTSNAFFRNPRMRNLLDICTLGVINIPASMQRQHNSSTTYYRHHRWLDREK